MPTDQKLGSRSGPFIDLGPADLAERELRGIEISGADRRPSSSTHVLLSLQGGELCAIDDQCNHAGCLLSSGWIDGDAVVCPCHEYAFELRTGRNVTLPRLCEDQRRFEVRVVEGRVLLRLDKEAGDER
jgi:3-phenylpropionate/trans-cinnamate dioxygenase ferredoxin component